MKKYPIEKSPDQWRAKLSDKEYNVLRLQGTEHPHTGEFNLHFKEGNYCCKGCDAELFASDHKFESGCGWPSFDKAIEGAIEYIRDTTHGMIRTETRCANCGGHLGHVFEDGPQETTGRRYCINSASLNFNPHEE